MASSHWLGSRLGLLIGGALGMPILGSVIGNVASTGKEAGAFSDGAISDALKQGWNDITGKTNTQIQNSAASALQEDAQQHQIDMLGHETAASLEYAKQLPSAQVQGLMDAGLNPWLAAGNGFSGSMASSGAGVASAQASNVSTIQSIANTAITAGMLIKILKTMK